MSHLSTVFSNTKTPYIVCICLINWVWCDTRLPTIFCTHCGRTKVCEMCSRQTWDHFLQTQRLKNLTHVQKRKPAASSEAMVNPTSLIIHFSKFIFLMCASQITEHRIFWPMALYCTLAANYQITAIYIHNCAHDKPENIYCINNKMHLLLLWSWNKSCGCRGRPRACCGLCLALTGVSVIWAHLSADTQLWLHLFLI